MDDIEVIWQRHSAVSLARRFEALADEFATFGMGLAADQVRKVLTADYDPRPDQLPQLGDPPTVRPAVPPRPAKPEVGS
jgi:hypothetical protein